MKKHEDHCTKNPNRVCNVCVKLLEEKQTPISDLLKLLPVPEIKDDGYGCMKLISPTTKELNDFLPALRDASNNCPACIMATLRQKGFYVSFATNFNWKNEMGKIWDNINDANSAADY